MAEHVVFIGAGKLGSALGGLISSKGARVSAWDVAPGKVPGQRPIEALVPEADAVFFCVPSWTLRDAAATVRPRLKKGTPVVSVSKGLEQGSRKTAEEILEEQLPSAPFVFIGGPLLADEITAGRPAFGVVASRDRRARERIADLFRGTKLAVETSGDAEGVVWSAILKNIYALGLGVAEGLDWGSNAKGWYVARAVEEAGVLIKALGGNPATFGGTAGLGDLIATGFSPHSMNRKAGEELARTGRCAVKSEGCATLPVLLERLGTRVAKLPILEAIKEIVVDAASAKDAFGRLARH